MDNPQVVAVMTVYYGAAYIERATRSLLRGDYSNLRRLVMDDCLPFLKRVFTRLLHLDYVDRAMSEIGYSSLKADLVRASALRLLSALYQSGRTGQTVWL